MAAQRVRREPPHFRRVQLRGTAIISDRLLRITLGGDELDGFTVELPAASVRLLLPQYGTDTLTIPTWAGNEFRHDDGLRPTIRTYTPRRFDAGARELHLDVVLHDGGAVPAWTSAASIGDPVAISGPGRGYAIDPEADRFLLAGDESAIPAISQILEQLPPRASTEVLLEAVLPTARHDLPEHSSATVTWHNVEADEPPGTALVAAVTQATIDADTHVWAAGEAAAMQRIRRHLFESVQLPRSQAVVRGYWKHGRGDAADEPE